MSELKLALRTLGKNPGYTLIAALILALGIGGTTTIFGAVNAVLMRPLDFPHPDRLVAVFDVSRGRRGVASPPDFNDWHNRNTVFSGLTAIDEGAFALTGAGPAEQIPGARVTGDFFGVMDTPVLKGRSFGPSDAVQGAPRVAVIGYGLWQRRFGGRSSLIGKTARFDSQPYTIVGVMPPGFDYPHGSGVWLPLSFSSEVLEKDRGAHYLDVIGRLRNGVTLGDASRQMRRIGAQLAAAYPRTNAGGSADVAGLREAIVGHVRPAMLILLGAVVLVLLIAGTNVASLMLTRGVGRERELAIRAALGAGRWRLARTLLVESLVLATIGGLGGFLLALLGGRLIAALHGVDIPLLDRTAVDGPVLAFAASVTLLTGILVGILPAWQTTSLSGLAQKLKDASRGSSGGRRRMRIRNLMVAVQTALAVVLLVGAGLLMRSFVRLQNVDLGFDPAGVLTFGISMPDAKYGDQTARAAFTERLTERLNALPGVRSAGAVFGLPLTGFSYGISGHSLDGRLLDDEEQDRLSVQVRTVTPGYFRTMGIPIRQGRAVEPADRAGAPRVMVINEAAAKLLWPDRTPIGHHFTIGTDLGGKTRAGGEVVGVVGNLRDDAPGVPARPEIFLSQAQFPRHYLGVALRTKGDPSSLVAPARQALADVDPDVPMFEVRTMQQLVDDAVGRPRLYSVLLGAFAMVALLLAAIGLYGILSQSVAQRTREIGVRMALGAERADVVRMIAHQSVVLASIGVGAGLVAAVFATRLLRGLLFSVQPTDAATFALVVATLAVVAAVASIPAAIRATRIDPAEALRNE